MTPVNNVRRFRREVLIRLVKAFMTGRMVEFVDKIPFEMYPKDAESPRCCVYKSRAIARSACLAGMGFMLEHDEDDSIPLAHYARMALERKQPESPIITVNEIACKACVPARYFITNACQGCIARQCAVSCSFNAITFANGQAVIDPAKCKNCGRCRDACPYQAITRITVPCEGACPVKAIHKSENGRAEIDFDKCTSCGRCMRACPFTALLERSQVIDVLSVLASGSKVVALLAPAIVGQFPGTFSQIRKAVHRLGFAETVEVAHGADITAEKEAEEYIERMERGDTFMTTSCCPAYVETVRRHAKELLPHVSETKTPMHYSAKAAKEKDPESVVVFIGPCVAKRYEGIQDEYVDYVLTFEEVGSLFVAKDIDVAACGDLPDDAEVPTAEARGFAVTGGVAGAVASRLPEGTSISCHCVNGLSPQGVAQLKCLLKAKHPPPSSKL